MNRHLMVASVLLAACPEPASPAEVSVLDHGALADGRTDDTAAFQKALDAAAKLPGSTVHAPPGRYLIAGTVVLKAPTTLRGARAGSGRQNGTILLATGGKGRTDGHGCIVMQPNTTLRGVAVEYPEQDAQARAPTPYPYAITGAPSCLIENVYLHNPYQGINLNGCHLNTVRDVRGEPLRVGIHADHTYDVSRIENIHFWPYFTLGKPLREWVQSNGVAFEFGRSDWQSCVNTFCYGYHTGYRFFATEEDKQRKWAAGTTNGSFVGIGADRACIGIDVENCFSIGVSVTNAMIGPFGAVKGARAVLMRESNTGNMTLTNCNFWAVTSSLAEVRGGSLTLNGCNIHAWALLDKEAPCLKQTGGRLKVTGCTLNQGGYFAELAGKESRALFHGNMGTAPLTVRSSIGDRLTTATNDPPIEANALAPATP